MKILQGMKKKTVVLLIFKELGFIVSQNTIKLRMLLKIHSMFGGLTHDICLRHSWVGFPSFTDLVTSAMNG